MKILIWIGLPLCFISAASSSCERCDPNATCEFDECVCMEGFVGNGTKCIKEEAECKSKCPPKTKCVNGTCVKTGSNMVGNCKHCPDNSSCVNGECQCKCGFKQEGDKCLDTDTVCKRCPELSSCENVMPNCTCNNESTLDGTCCVRVHLASSQAHARQNVNNTVNPLDSGKAESGKQDNKAIMWLNKVLTNVDKISDKGKEPKNVPKYRKNKKPNVDTGLQPPGNPTPDLESLANTSIHPEAAVANSTAGSTEEEENPEDNAPDIDPGSGNHVIDNIDDIEKDVEVAPMKEDQQVIFPLATAPPLIPKSGTTKKSSEKPATTAATTTSPTPPSNPSPKSPLNKAEMDNNTKNAANVPTPGPTIALTTTKTTKKAKIKANEFNATFPTPKLPLFPPVQYTLPSIQIYPNIQELPLNPTPESPPSNLLPALLPPQAPSPDLSSMLTPVLTSNETPSILPPEGSPYNAVQPSQAVMPYQFVTSNNPPETNETLSKPTGASTTAARKKKRLSKKARKLKKKHKRI